MSPALILAPGHDNVPARVSFVYANLERALSQDPVVEEVQCPVVLQANLFCVCCSDLLLRKGGEVLKEVDETCVQKFDAARLKY